MIRSLSLGLTLVLVALTGCRDPYSRPAASTRTPSAPPSPQASVSPAPKAPRPRPAALGQTPEAAVGTFARLYINWTATTVAAHLDRLAHSSSGEAASEMARAAQESRSDYELHRSGVFNRGTVESIAPQHGHPRRYVIVTLEATGATSKEYAGLRPAFHVTLASVERTTAGWTVSAWLPQS